MSLYFSIKHFLRQSINNRSYMLHRLFITGAVSLMFVLLLLEKNFLLAEKSTAGLEIFSNIIYLLFLFIIFLVPVLTCKLIDKDRKNGVLPLLFMTNTSVFKIILCKYISFLVLVFVHGCASLPVFLMCSLLGGISGAQILYSYSILFAFASLISAASIQLASRWQYSPLQSLILITLITILMELSCGYFGVIFSPIAAV